MRLQVPAEAEGRGVESLETGLQAAGGRLQRVLGPDLASARTMRSSLPHLSSLLHLL